MKSVMSVFLMLSLLVGTSGCKKLKKRKAAQAQVAASVPALRPQAQAQPTIPPPTPVQTPAQTIQKCVNPIIFTLNEIQEGTLARSLTGLATWRVVSGKLFVESVPAGSEALAQYEIAFSEGDVSNPPIFRDARVVCQNIKTPVTGYFIAPTMISWNGKYSTFFRARTELMNQKVMARIDLARINTQEIGRFLASRADPLSEFLGPTRLQTINYELLSEGSSIKVVRAKYALLNNGRIVAYTSVEFKYQKD